MVGWDAGKAEQSPRDHLGKPSWQRWIDMSGGLLLHLWGSSASVVFFSYLFSGDLLLVWSPEQQEVFSCEGVMG